MESKTIAINTKEWVHSFQHISYCFILSFLFRSFWHYHAFTSKFSFRGC